MKRVLMIAFQFPPFSGSSAIQRTLRFVQHLPAFGWDPVVLSAVPTAYEATSDDLLKSVPGTVPVERAYALDAARVFSLAGRYPRFLVRPDRWTSWKFDAVRVGQSLIARLKPDAIWSTYPIPTAHLIGSRLQRKSGIPWIADFRDPMAQDGYPSDRRTWQMYREIEQDALKRARFSVFTTPGAASLYRGRYPEVAPDRICVIENGYDESTFSSLDGTRLERPLTANRLTLVHSGAVYSSERDPTQFFEALGRLRQDGRLSAERVKVRFRASSNDELLARLARRNQVEDLVELLPPLPYGEAVEEMVRADGLIVLQAANCNQQIPAKIYEYLRAGRPLLALTDATGDTAAVLRRCGMVDIAPLDSVDAIEHAFLGWIDAIGKRLAATPDPSLASRNSRVARTRELAGLLDRAVV